MKIGEQRQGGHRIAIRAIALLNMTPLLYAMGRLAIHFLPKVGLAPCEDSDSLTQTALASEAALVVIGIWLQDRVFRHPSYTLLVAALLAPLAVWLLQDAADSRDALREQQCAARPLAEAMRACGANPAYYRLKKDEHGYDVLTVIAPGTTDRAWWCLARWSDHNGSASIKVDESVYRRKHPQRE